MKYRLSILITILTTTTLSFHLNGYADEYSVSSPDKRIEVKVENDQKIRFSVTLNGNVLISPSSISLKLADGSILGQDAVVDETQRQMINNIITPVVKQKSETITEYCNELRLIFEEDFNLVFRAYNEGVAYRFETRFDDQIRIASEEVTFNFVSNDTAFFPEEESMMSHNERLYEKLTFGEMTPGSFCSLPVLINTYSGNHVLITEADLSDYPGLWLEVNENQTFSGILPGVALEEEQQNDRNVRISKVADYIAETQGSRTYPWRVMVIGENDADLILNQMVFILSKPLQLEDPSWIKPGKVAWDWWNALNLYGVDFKSGINTETYKYYIDFASKYGIEYIILDEGWYELGDLMSINPDIDMEQLLAYGEEKNVGIILWVVWKTLEDQLETALDQFEEWGVKGIKVDFMQRDDQWMVNYYWKIAEEAAKRKLLVDFHGSYKPSGLRRAYPNVLTREGVRGLEHCKWSDQFVPGHEVTIPFIRMIAGPMDYTPGAMNNAQRRNYRPINARPMSMGTRCHQLAMYVVFESPLQMLADSPSNYLREPECMAFLEKVPTVWDETVVLHAKVEDYVAIARRLGEEWYVGVMTDENARTFDIDLSFLDSGDYTMDSYQDGINANSYGSDYKRTISTVSRDQHVQIELARGGGWTARIVKK